MSSARNGHISWGILGCGDVTEVKSGPALQKADRSSVVSVMRRDAARAADYAARHNVPHWTADADALIADAEVSAIYVATPPSTHAEYAIRALQAGKDVLVEKPMAMSTEECDRMAAAVEDSGRKLCIAFYRRALPRFEQLRQIVQDGTIGAPRLVEVRHFTRGEDRPDQPWKTDPAIGGGGFFPDMQSHTLDWLSYTFGPPTAAQGLRKYQAGAYDAEDLVSYILDFGALPAVGLCAYATDRQEDSVTIHGSDGSASMGFFGPSPIALARGGTTETIVIPDPPHVHQPMIERVVAHFVDGAPNPCSAVDGRRVNALLEQIFSGLAGQI